MARYDDTDQHARDCYELHHNAEKRLSVLETKLSMIESNQSTAIDEVKIRLEKFDKSFSEVAIAINGLRLDLNIMANSAKLKTSVIKDTLPFLIAILSAGWAIFLYMHH